VAGEQELEGLNESDQLSAVHDVVRASPLPHRSTGPAQNPASQGQLSRSDAHSFYYSLAPPTKGLLLHLCFCLAPLTVVLHCIIFLHFFIVLLDCVCVQIFCAINQGFVLRRCILIWPNLHTSLQSVKQCILHHAAKSRCSLFSHRLHSTKTTQYDCVFLYNVKSLCVQNYSKP